MDMTIILLAFSLAALMVAATVSWLATVRPQWSRRRRVGTAASFLPAVTAIATGLGILFIASSNHGQGDQMEDLAIAAVATIGGGFALLALFGGFLGASLASRGRGA